MNDLEWDNTFSSQWTSRMGQTKEVLRATFHLRDGVVPDQLTKGGLLFRPRMVTIEWEGPIGKKGLSYIRLSGSNVRKDGTEGTRGGVLIMDKTAALRNDDIRLLWGYLENWRATRHA